MNQSTSNLSNSFSNRLKRIVGIFSIALLAVLGFDLSTSFVANKNVVESFSFTTVAKATSVYHNFSGGNLTLAVNSATINQITSNNDWSNVPSVEGYCGSGLTNTHGVDPRTVTGTGTPNNQLPASNPCVNANKGNPSAYNGSGVTEFDDPDTYMAIGFQGNVQNNPYLVFYLNTTGQGNVRMTFDVIDIDAGNNNSVSQIAVQYRVGETGNFINIPGGFVADATDGNRTAGRVTKIDLVLPTAALNQPKVQVRVLSTFGAGTDGNQTPNEWIGVNNFVFSATAPSAASVMVGGKVTTATGRGIRNVQVRLTDETGETRTAMTSAFGYYRFADVPAGRSYVISIASKRFAFTQPAQVLSLTEDTDNLDFVADN